MEGHQVATDTGSTSDHSTDTRQCQTTEERPQNILSANPAPKPRRRRNRSQRNSPAAPTKRQRKLPLAPALPLKSATAPALATDPPVKRKRGRPRKQPLPSEPSPNPALGLNRENLTQLLTTAKHGRETTDEQYGPLPEHQQRSAARSTLVKTEATTDPLTAAAAAPTTSAPLPTHQFRPVGPSYLPPIIPAPTLTQRQPYVSPQPRPIASSILATTEAATPSAAIAPRRSDTLPPYEFRPVLSSHPSLIVPAPADNERHLHISPQGTASLRPTISAAASFPVHVPVKYPQPRRRRLPATARQP